MSRKPLRRCCRPLTGACSLLVLGLWLLADAGQMAHAAPLSARSLVGPPTPGTLPRADVIRHYGRDFVLSPSCKAAGRRLQPIDSDYRLQVYLNFDGVTLKPGGNDSHTNQTPQVSGPLDYPALDWSRFGGREKGLKDTVDELKLLFGDFAVEFVTARPASGDYTMAVIGGRGDGIQTGSGDAVGVAPLDCKNSEPNDVALIFGQSLDSPKQLAFVIAHELGHTFGLEHVSDTKGIMYPALTAQTCCWVDSGLSEASTCGRTSQDADKVLLDNLGVGPGDTIPPLVWVVRPGEGATVPASFSFEAGSADDLRVHHVTLYLDGKQLAEISSPPYVMPLFDLSAGEHVLRAEAYDWKPNMVSTELTITVVPDCPADGSCYFGGAGVGNACETGADCSSGLCATRPDGKGVCTTACAGEAGSCPEATACRELGGKQVCAGDGDGWSLSSGGGGCGVGPGAAAGAPALVPPLLLALVLLLGLAVRRCGPGSN